MYYDDKHIYMNVYLRRSGINNKLYSDYKILVLFRWRLNWQLFTFWVIVGNSADHTPSSVDSIGSWSLDGYRGCRCEKVTLWWDDDDDDDVSFVLEQQLNLDVYSASLPKQDSTDIQIAPLRHIIQTSRQPIFYLYVILRAQQNTHKYQHEVQIYDLMTPSLVQSLWKGILRS